MRKRIFLYSLLVTFVLTQVVLMKCVTWFPDIILLIVVFTGVFWGGVEGLGVGFAAGFLRGCFSIGTLPVDILVFSAVGVISWLLAKMFYHQNPVVQIVITIVALLIVVISHTVYLNVISGNNVSLPLVLLASRMSLTVTVFISPVVFSFLKGLVGVKE